jgi:hypothetical protein
MRAAVLAVLLLLPAPAVRAGVVPMLKFSAPEPRLAIPSQRAFAPQRPGDDLPLLGPERTPPASAESGFSIGPFRAEAGTSFRPGHRSRLSPHYRLDGVSVLGGSVGGTIGKGGGMITLQWQTSP